MKKTMLSGGLLAAMAAACSADMTELTLSDDDGVNEAAIEPSGPVLLSLGDRGPEVQAAHEFFTNYGYFDNPSLQAEFPGWEPLVGGAPADDNLFGEELQLAVSAFQARAALPVTGAIDAATHELMNTPRCGVPDTARSNLEEKWAGPNAFDWQSDHTLTYRFSLDASDNYGDMTEPQVRAAITAAFNTWEVGTSLVFTETTSTNQDILVSFIDLSGSTLAVGTKTALFIDNRSSWGFGSNDFHLQSVALHEIGHSIGLEHSSMDVPTIAVMWPALDPGENRSTLQSDERNALAASPYTPWRGISGSANQANDIGASMAVDNGAEVAWMLGTGTNSEGFKLFRFLESSDSWQQVTGGGVRLDVAGRTPWVVTNQGLAKQLGGVTSSTPNGTSWISRGDLNFVDIGASPSGVVWALGGTPSNGNYDVYRFIGGVSWVEVDGDARYIDVGPNGDPWVVTAQGSIYHRNGVTSSNPNGTSWSLYGSGAKDVAVGPEGSVWVSGHSIGPHVYQLNVQPGVAANCGAADCSVPARNQWFPTANGGSAAFISIGKDALPWVVGPDLSLWRKRE